tara:strand:+ start:163 stop:1887 length:1725 start_codon:yes stop_codon:yes gene_type:complete
MKVLLTCTSIEEASRHADDVDSHYPLGLAYLHSYLEKHSDYDIQTHFLNNVDQETCFTKVKEEIETFKPDVVGISIMTFSRTSSYRMIEYITENHPDIKIVLGGMHPTVMWRSMLKKYTNTVIVVGEGELTFHELLQHFEEDKDIKDVQGIAYHDGEQVVKNDERDLIDDLDTLEFPKHEIFLWEGKKMANLLTSRGCPFKCNFCVLDHISLRKVRFRSAEDVCDEIEQILEICPTVENIWLHDDAFMINKKSTTALCEEIIRRGIKTSFTCSARFRPVSRDLIRLMEKAGFTHVLFGLESAAQVIMDDMKKGITKDHIRYATSLFAETSIKTTAFLIVGLPNETQETVDETIDFIQEMQNNNYLFYDDIGVAMIYPGAELYTMAKARGLEVPDYGLLDDEYWMTSLDVPYYLCENSLEQILEWKEEIRNAIALPRVNDPKNFLKQKKLLPSIVKYSFKFGLGGIIQGVQESMQKHNTFPQLIQTFFAGDPNDLIPVISKNFEKDLIGTFMQKMSMDEKKQFIVDYEEQSREDKETLKRWAESHHPAADEYVAIKKEKAHAEDTGMPDLINIVQ